MLICWMDVDRAITWVNTLSHDKQTGLCFVSVLTDKVYLSKFVPAKAIAERHKHIALLQSVGRCSTATKSFI